MSTPVSRLVPAAPRRRRRSRSWGQLARQLLTGGLALQGAGAQAPPAAAGRVGRQGDALVLSWPAVGVASRFSGSQIAVQFAPDNGSRSVYGVQLDGAERARIARRAGVELYPLASDLDAGEHTVTLTKLTSAQLGEDALLRFVPGPGGRLLPTPPLQRPLRLGFLGDSVTVGFGVLGQAPCQNGPDVEDVSRAFPSLVAAALDATPFVIAESGKGVYRNYDYVADPETLPLLAQHVTCSLTAPWWPQGDAPALTVVTLGGNDLHGRNLVGGPEQPFNVAAFTDAYTDLAGRLLAGGAPLVLALSPTLAANASLTPALGGSERDVVRGALEAVRARLNSTQVHVFAFERDDGHAGKGCSGHPNVATQASMAAQLLPLLRRLLGG